MEKSSRACQTGTLFYFYYTYTMFTIIGRTPSKGLLVDARGVLRLIYLDHSAEHIAENFYALPVFETYDQAADAFPELRIP